MPIALWDCSWRKAPPIDMLFSPKDFDEVASFLKPPRNHFQPNIFDINRISVPEKNFPFQRQGRLTVFYPDTLVIYDDWQGIHGDEKLGKPVFSDIHLKIWGDKAPQMDCPIIQVVLHIPDWRVPTVWIRPYHSRVLGCPRNKQMEMEHIEFLQLLPSWKRWTQNVTVLTPTPKE